MSKTLLILLVMFCALLGSFGQIFFKLASKSFSLSIEGILKNPYFFFGVFLYGISAILFIFSLKQGELSVLYPVIATSYIFVTFLSFFFFKESITTYKIFGVILIVLGVWLITR
ncbi:MAG: EamA family transporter [Candidatus Pacearchaeota archaeon]